MADTALTFQLINHTNMPAILAFTLVPYCQELRLDNNYCYAYSPTE